MQKPIPFGPDEAAGLDEIGGASPEALNVILEPNTGLIRRRPGIRASSLAYPEVIDPNGLCGLYVSESGAGHLGGVAGIYAVGAVGSERPIYNVTPGGAVTLGGGVALTGLRGATRPIFAETEMILAIAGGSELQKVEFATNTSSRIADNPPLASHVVANASRLLANDVAIDRTKIRYSDQAQGLVTFAGLETWTNGPTNTSGFFTAEANPDPVVAVFQNTNEVYVFGTKTTQVFGSDPSFVFSPVVAREYGCIAPFGAVEVDGGFYWLDHLKRFIAGDGRSQQTLSDAIKRALDAMTRVDDCFGYRAILGPMDAVVWTFPTDGRTFVFQRGAAWSQWTGWDNVTNNRAPFTVTAHAMAGPVNLVATSDGHIGELSFDAHTDLGTRIDASMMTGYLNRGTDNRKLCRKVKVAMRRGSRLTTPGPTALLKWRDEPGDWQSITIDTGSSGDTEIVVDIPSLGVYRRRQWCFEFAAPEELALASVTEDFTILEN